MATILNWIISLKGVGIMEELKTWLELHLARVKLHVGLLQLERDIEKLAVNIRKDIETNKRMWKKHDEEMEELWKK